jgi:two-component system response regulator
MVVLVLVEDNDDDRELALLAFRQAKVAAELVAVADGEQALDYLFTDGSVAPGKGELKVVLLDLKLPKIDGLEVLRRIRAHWRTRHLPVVILTSSLEQTDLIESYRLGANSYLRKPVNFGDFVELAGNIGNYWGRFNQTPPANAA